MIGLLFQDFSGVWLVVARGWVASNVMENGREGKRPGGREGQLAETG